MEKTPPAIGELVCDAVRLTNELLDAADGAVLEEHAAYCRRVARQLWRSVCHLLDGLPASDADRSQIERLCADLEKRIEATP